MTTERRVRFTERFFEQLDRPLPEERASDGTPSVTDFIVLELPRIRDRLAEDAIAASVPTEVPDVRVLLSGGLLVTVLVMYMTVYDDTVEVFDIRIQLG